jgi:hypothetical protein
LRRNLGKGDIGAEPVSPVANRCRQCRQKTT